MTRQLIFENGAQFTGTPFGAARECVAEVVTNTAMVGYQELLTDPAMLGRMVLMTYPLIGNYGLTDEDNESYGPCVSGLIVREYNSSPTNYRYIKSLGDVMEDSGIPGISDVDTREISRMLLREGAMRALLTDARPEKAEALEKIKNAPVPRGLVRAISCKRLWFSRTANYRYNVAVIDLGVKHSVIRQLNDRGCNVTIMPYNTDMEAVLSLKPDGLLLPDGPGEAADLPGVIGLVRAMRGKIPMLGISLGHQIIALAEGALLLRMKRPHRGGNYPVRELCGGRVLVTSQNHALAVDPSTLSGTGLSVSHRNLLDDTVEGLENGALSIRSTQFNPESASDGCGHLFDAFIADMEKQRQEVR